MAVSAKGAAESIPIIVELAWPVIWRRVSAFVMGTRSVLTGTTVTPMGRVFPGAGLSPMIVAQGVPVIQRLTNASVRMIPRVLTLSIAMAASACWAAEQGQIIAKMGSVIPTPASVAARATRPVDRSSIATERPALLGAVWSPIIARQVCVT